MPDNPPAPSPAAVLYVDPRKDGKGRLCGNCIMWVRAEGGSCVIHLRDMLVKRTAVCGYYVAGDPMAEWMDHPGIEPLSPRESGFEEVGLIGTKCGNCRHYEAGAGSRGTCARVQAPGRPEFTPAPVHRDGCCAAWERSQGAGSRLRGMR